MSNLKSPLQLHQEIIIHATPERVWEVFNDQSLLPKWTHDVQKSNYDQQMASPGQLRRNECIVNGKMGTIETRCVTMIGKYRAEFIVERDSFGMTKMLKGMSFAAEFQSIDSGKTKFIMQSNYRPKNIFLKLINGLIKKKMGKEVEIMLKGLKNYIETGKPNPLNPINR